LHLSDYQENTLWIYFIITSFIDFEVNLNASVFFSNQECILFK